MTAKEYLRQLEVMDLCINQKIAERDALYAKASGSGARFDKEPIQGPGPSDSVGNLAAKLADLGAEIDAEIDGYAAAKHRIINQIHSLKNELYIQLLHKRYVEYKRLELIAVEMNYSYDRTRHLHGAALQAFDSRYFKRAPLDVSTQ